MKNPNDKIDEGIQSEFIKLSQDVAPLLRYCDALLVCSFFKSVLERERGYEDKTPTAEQIRLALGYELKENLS